MPGSALSALRQAIRVPARAVGKYAPPVALGSTALAGGISMAAEPAPITGTIRTDPESADHLMKEVNLSQDAAPFIDWQTIDRPREIPYGYPESGTMYDQLKGVLEALRSGGKSNKA